MTGPSQSNDPVIAVHDLLAGWDMAFVTSLKAMNEALRKQNLWPLAISIADPESKNPTFNATVSDLRLAVDSKAVGGRIVLAIDLHNATLSDGSDGPLDCTFYAEAELEAVADKPGPPDPRLAKLGADTSPFLIKKLTGMNSVRLREPDDPDLERCIRMSRFKDPLERWLNGELMELAMVFAASMPGLKEIASSADFHWVLPAGLAYAVAIPDLVGGKLPPEDRCVFALLGVTDLNSLPGLIPQILPEVLPPGVDAVYALSSALLLSTIIGPAVLAGLQATGTPRLNLSGSDDGVTLSNFDPLTLPDLDLRSDQNVSDFAQTGSDVRIDPGQLSISIDGDSFIISVFQMGFTTAKGAEEVELTFTYKTGLATDSDGTIHLTTPAGFVGGAQVALTDKAISYEMWSKFIVAVITAVLSCIPFGGEDSVVVKEAVETGESAAAATATADTAEITATDSAEIAAQADKELAGASPGLRGFAGVFAKKAGLMVGLALGQEVLTDAPSLLKMYQDRRGVANIESWTDSLNAIASAVAAIAWFGNDSKKAVRCVGAELNRGLIVHLNFGTAA